MGGLVADRGGDGRGLGLLLCRCAQSRARPRDPASRPCGLCHHRRAHRHDLYLWWLHARTDLHLHVPLAPHPRRDDGPRHADRRLPQMAGGAAREGWGEAPASRRRRDWQRRCRGALWRRAGHKLRRRPPVAQRRRAGGLYRLQRLCRRLPDGDRHPRRSTDGVYYLRPLHRRL